jgi:1,4-alpha-glucan branching enzyme
VDNPDLKYRYLDRYDKEMITLIHTRKVLEASWPYLLHEHNHDKVIAFHRKGLIFVFNFHPTKSYADYGFQVPPGAYRMILDSDAPRFGGHGRLTPHQVHHSQQDIAGEGNVHRLHLYLPTRTGLVLEPVSE